MKRIICGLAILALVVIALLPVGRALTRSLTVDGGYGLDHYRQAFDRALAAGSNQRLLFTNTLLLGGLATLIAVLLGVPYAFLTSHTNLPGKGLFIALYVLPVIVPPLLSAIAWTQLALHLSRWTDRPPSDFVFGGLWGSAFVFGFAYLPFVILFSRRAFARIPASLEEAGLVSVGLRWTLRRVVLPLVLPGVLAGAVFVFLFTICDFAVVDYLNTYNVDPELGGAYGDFRVYPIEAFAEWSSGRRPELATAIGSPLAVLALLALGLAFHLRRRSESGLVGTTWRSPPEIRLGRWTVPATLFCLLVIVLGFGIPVGTLAYHAGSIETFRVVLDDAGEPLRNSLVYAGLAATFATMLAFVLAWMTTRARPPVARLLEILVFVPLAFPPIMLGFGLLVTWNPVDPVILGIGYKGQKLVVPIVLITLIAKYTPFPYIAILAHLRSLERSQEEAAEVAGVPWGARMWRILVPLTRPGIVTGWILAFVFCLREIDTLAIVSGVETAMHRIYGMIHTAQDDRVAALCVMEVGLLGLPFLLYALVTWRRLRVI